MNYGLCSQERFHSRAKPRCILHIKHVPTTQHILLPRLCLIDNLWRWHSHSSRDQMAMLPACVQANRRLDTSNQLHIVHLGRRYPGFERFCRRLRIHRRNNLSQLGHRRRSQDTSNAPSNCLRHTRAIHIRRTHIILPPSHKGPTPLSPTAGSIFLFWKRSLFLVNLLKCRMQHPTLHIQQTDERLSKYVMIALDKPLQART